MSADAGMAGVAASLGYENYAWGLLSFVLGILAGFQGVHETFGKEALSAAKTWPGLFYLLSRALLPAVAFIVALIQQWLHWHPALLALAMGVATESILRSQFFLRQQGGDPLERKEISKGIFDLLRWYQDWLLEHARVPIAIQRLESMQRHAPPGPVREVLRRAISNLPAWPDPADRDFLTKELSKLEADLAEDLKKEPTRESEFDEAYRMRVYMVFRNKLGEEAAEKFLASSRQDRN